MSNDRVMDRINAAINTLHAGERAQAATSLASIYAEISDRGDPFHLCILSHFMADAQNDPERELEWDLRALEAAAKVTEQRAKDHHSSLSISSFYPSLHLNAGDAYLRLGMIEQARKHVLAAQACLTDVADTPLGDMTRAAIGRLADRVEAVYTPRG